MLVKATVIDVTFKVTVVVDVQDSTNRPSDPITSRSKSAKPDSPTGYLSLLLPLRRYSRHDGIHIGVV